MASKLDRLQKKGFKVNEAALSKIARGDQEPGGEYSEININDIEKYKGKSLFVTRENAVELEEDEYYIGDLIGMEVYTDDSEERFGVLKDVMETGANEVYIICLLYTSPSPRDTR